MRSNCLFEALKAKIKNPKVNIFGKYPRDVIAKFNKIF